MPENLQKRPKSASRSPRELLESRYQAFVDGNIDYIFETHHPETREQLDRKAIEEWSRHSKWLGLQIEEERPIDADKEQLVFTVRYEKNFETINHREIAEFRRSDGEWYYFDSEFPKPASFKREGEKIGRNEPCTCGSGKKYKKCHGA